MQAIQRATALSNRQPAWAGVGESGAWTDYREALDACGLDYRVHPQNAHTHMYNMFGTRTEQEVPGIQVNVRDGSDTIMGVTSDNYGIVQNEDAFQMLEPFTKAGGVITNGGMTEQGLAFMVLRLCDMRILGDDYDLDVMCTNSFNGAFPCALIMVPHRIICQNMYRGIIGKGDDYVLRFRHCSQIEDRMAQAMRATSAVLYYESAFEMQLEKAYGNVMSDHDVRQLICMLFPYPKPGGKREAMTRERIDEMREGFYNEYYLASDNANFVGSGMGFVNAYMDYLTHRVPTKNMPGDWDSRRLSGLVSGSDVKAKVIEAAIG